MHRSELWLVQENHATVKLDSIVASPGMKTYSKSGRMELRNLQILKKMFEKPCQFLSSKQPCEPKTLDVALIVAGDQNTLKKMRLRSTLEAIWFKFSLKQALVTVEICDLCGW